EKEIITWNMAPDKTMVIDYCCEDTQFEATFCPNNDLYVVKFKCDDKQLMLPLNIYKYVLDE
ncbi:unnamed protein product, partial [Rotaria sp. Silwood2]